jgi:hypothetical protein
MSNPEFQGYQQQAMNLQQQLKAYEQQAPQYQQLQNLQSQMSMQGPTPQMMEQGQALSQQMNDYMQKSPLYSQMQDLQGKIQNFATQNQPPQQGIGQLGQPSGPMTMDIQRPRNPQDDQLINSMAQPGFNNQGQQQQAFGQQQQAFGQTAPFGGPQQSQPSGLGSGGFGTAQTPAMTQQPQPAQQPAQQQPAQQGMPQSRRPFGRFGGASGGR